MGIKLDKDSLATEQDNYFTKIVNDLATWPRNPTIIPNLGIACLEQLI